MKQFGNVEDRLEIQELNQRYAVHVDLHQIEEWVSLFTPGALFDEREFGNQLFIGHEEIRSYGQHLAEVVQYALHHMTTHVVTELRATSACGIAFAVVDGLLKDGSHSRNHVIYKDRYEKIDGRWLIAERVLKKTIPTEVLSNAS